MDAAGILERVRRVAEDFARERRSRQLRRELDPADFERLREAGFLLTGVPSEMGGVFESPARSIRAIAAILRVLASGDSSVALVASMHPIVRGFWNAVPEVPPPFQQAWAEQRRALAETALDGAWWGTITSEPGTGGDVAQTKALARPREDGSGYLLSGEKHFGSGSGITSYMITSAVAAGETEPDTFFIRTQGVPWDGSQGVTLVAPWDGQGMTATQSHAFRFMDVPATRVAWPGHVREIQLANGGTSGCCFSAVVVGIVETAHQATREQLDRRRASLRAYERVEWGRIELEVWLIQQAFEGMLRAVETLGGTPPDVLKGKTAIAELAESAIGRMCRIVGGGSYSRRSPLGFWLEDVRALGFLRPPWGLAFDRLFENSWAQPG
jgi:alkylation response protein AidB-like acyl-CoA dehydrogenase